MQDGANTPLSTTFQQTGGGRTGPYKAAAFDLTPCSDLPSLEAVGDVSRASEILDAYLVRVGADGTCLTDPNFQGLCNPPLSAATEYRWVQGPLEPAAVPQPPLRASEWDRPRVSRACYVLRVSRVPRRAPGESDCAQGRTLSRAPTWLHALPP